MEILDHNGLSHVVEKIYDVVHSGGSADYIVEESTSGAWTYRKWASGIAECWGRWTATTTSWSAWGSVYEGNNYLANLSFPTGLFNAIPIVTAQVGLNGTSGGVMTEMGQVSQTSIGYVIPIRPNAFSQPLDYEYFIYAKGYWKTFTPTAVPSIYTPTADYIVEEGTWLSGKYIKWNSGMAECYGYTSLTSAINSTYGSGGICYKDTSVSFPSTLFKSGTAPTVDITIQRAGGLLWPSIHGLTNTAVAFYIGSATSENSSTIYIHVIAKGVWK